MSNIRVTLIGVVAAFGLLGSGLTPAQAASPEPVEVGSTSECQDVVVLGAKGSGQTENQNEGFGPEAWNGFSAYARRMDGYKVGYYGVPYPAASVEKLKRQKTMGQFFSSIDRGVESTLQFLKARQEKCGSENERYALMGYSQGAMVMHRVLWQLARASTPYHQLGRQILPRLDGILVIADGDKVIDQGGVSYDTAPNSQAGIWWDIVDSPLIKDQLKYDTKTKYLPVDAPVPNLSYWPATRFHSVCHDSDIVCDYGSLNYSTAAKIHTDSYGPTGDSAVYVQSAATNIAKTSKQNLQTLTVPREVLPTVPVRVGQTGEVVLAQDGRDVASVQWLSDPVPSSEISPGEPTIPATLRWAPHSAVTVDYSVRVTFNDGSQKDVSGALQSFAVPPPSLSVTDLQSAYEPAPAYLGSGMVSKVTFDVIKATASDTTPSKVFTDREDPATDYYEYVSGDHNGNDILDLGESWSYRAFFAWGEWEPGNVRTRTVVVTANDKTGAGAFEEAEFGITLTR